jgi:hypothetical protein
MNVPVRQSGQAFDIIHTGFADIASLKGDAVGVFPAKGTAFWFCRAKHIGTSSYLSL